MAPAVPSVPSGGAGAHRGITPRTSPVLPIKNALPRKRSCSPTGTESKAALCSEVHEGDCIPNQLYHANFHRSRGVCSVPDPGPAACQTLVLPGSGSAEDRADAVQKSLRHTQIFCFNTPHLSPQRGTLVARRPHTNPSTQKPLQSRDGPRRRGAAGLAAL